MRGCDLDIDHPAERSRPDLTDKGAPGGPVEMKGEVLFSGIPTASLESAQPWYESLFGRPPDVVANDHEVMWEVREGRLAVCRRGQGPPRVTRSLP